MKETTGEEAIESFNLMIELHEKENLNDYYKEELETIEHFRYPNLFFRRTKNVFISMIPKDMIMQIVECEPVTYEMIRKRLYRRGLNVRIGELRDYYGTFMVRHGLIKEEVDLLQGRISKSIFVRHYWSPAISELRESPQGSRRTETNNITLLTPSFFLMQEREKT